MIIPLRHPSEMGKFFEDLHRSIRRSPVNHNMLEASKRLRRHTLDRLPQKTTMIERRRDYQNHRLLDIAKIVNDHRAYIPSKQRYEAGIALSPVRQVADTPMYCLVAIPTRIHVRD